MCSSVLHASKQFLSFVNANNVCIYFVTVNHCRIPTRNVPTTTVLSYVQYRYPLTWHSRKSCPHLRYYRGNIPAADLYPEPRWQTINTVLVIVFNIIIIMF